MTSHYPIVLEHEPNGTVSAYVVGLPGVFAAADTERAAGAAIRKALRAHLAALQSLPEREEGCGCTCKRTQGRPPSNGCEVSSG